MTAARARPTVLFMMRTLVIGLTALLALVLLAPAAQAKKRYGYFQDLSVTSQSPSSIFLTILYKDNHGNGRFTPRVADSYRLEAPVNALPGTRASSASAGTSSTSTATSASRSAMAFFPQV